jgi:hypothetical protein
VPNVVPVGLTFTIAITISVAERGIAITESGKR